MSLRNPRFLSSSYQLGRQAVRFFSDSGASEVVAPSVARSVHQVDSNNDATFREFKQQAIRELERDNLIDAGKKETTIWALFFPQLTYFSLFFLSDPSEPPLREFATRLSTFQPLQLAAYIEAVGELSQK